MMAVSGNSLQLRRERNSEVYFAYQPLGALVVLLFMMVVMALMGTNRQAAPVWVYLVIGLFVLFGVLGTLWREDLRLDLTLHRYAHRHGLWPWVKLTEGSLDELNAIVLTRRMERISNSNGPDSEYPTWQVALEFCSWGMPAPILSSRDEAAAHACFEHFAKKLRIRAVDRSGNTERSCDWSNLDAPLAPAGVSVDIGSPPPNSGIEVSGAPGARRIVLPRMSGAGATAGVLFMLLFGLVFAFFGSLAFGASVGFLHAKVSGSRPVLAGIGLLFAIIGAAIAALPLIGVTAREQIEESGDTLVFSLRLLGRTCRIRRLVRRTIEEIDVRADTLAHNPSAGQLWVGRLPIPLGKASPPGQEVFVRSDAAVVRLGLGLEPSARSWLRDALTQLVVTR